MTGLIDIIEDIGAVLDQLVLAAVAILTWLNRRQLHSPKKSSAAKFRRALSPRDTGVQPNDLTFRELVEGMGKNMLDEVARIDRRIDELQRPKK